MFHFLAGSGTLSLLLVVMAAVHCLRNGGGNWLFIIIFLGPLGAAAYFVVEVMGWVKLPGAAGGHFTPSRLKAPGIRESEAEVARLGNAPSYAALALAYHAKDRHADAVTAARTALAADASLLGARYVLGRALAAVGQAQEAAEELARVVQADPDHDYGVAILSLAEAQERASSGEAARATCLAAAERTSRGESLYRLAAILARLGDGESSRGLLERLVREAEFAPNFARKEAERWARLARTALKG